MAGLASECNGLNARVLTSCKIKGRLKMGNFSGCQEEWQLTACIATFYYIYKGR